MQWERRHRLSVLRLQVRLYPWPKHRANSSTGLRRSTFTVSRPHPQTSRDSRLQICFRRTYRSYTDKSKVSGCIAPRSWTSMSWELNSRAQTTRTRTRTYTRA